MKYQFLFCIGWLALGACSTTSDSLCGDGTEFGFDGQSYCLYQSAITEEGFECPAEVPNEYMFMEFRACGKPEWPPEGLEGEVYRLAMADGAVNAEDAGRDSGLDSTIVVTDSAVGNDSATSSPHLSCDSCEAPSSRCWGFSLPDAQGCFVPECDTGDDSLCGGRKCNAPSCGLDAECPGLCEGGVQPACDAPVFYAPGDSCVAPEVGFCIADSYVATALADYPYPTLTCDTALPACESGYTPCRYHPFPGAGSDCPDASWFNAGAYNKAICALWETGKVNKVTPIPVE